MRIAADLWGIPEELVCVSVKGSIDVFDRNSSNTTLEDALGIDPTKIQYWKPLYVTLLSRFRSRERRPDAPASLTIAKGRRHATKGPSVKLEFPVPDTGTSRVKHYDIEQSWGGEDGFWTPWQAVDANVEPSVVKVYVTSVHITPNT